MHLYKQINSLFDHFLKYSSLGDMLILLFSCSYLSYVESK